MTRSLTTERARELSYLATASKRRKAAVKRQLKAGEIPLSRALSATLPELTRLTVYRLLISVRGIRDVKANRIIRCASIAAERPLRDVRVCDLSEREQRLLLGAYARCCPYMNGRRG